MLSILTTHNNLIIVYLFKALSLLYIRYYINVLIQERVEKFIFMKQCDVIGI